MGHVLTYKEQLTDIMHALSLVRGVYFLGYNVKYGPKFGGTLAYCQENKLIEMPVAENLIMGAAMGMALRGYHPVVCIERMDFLWTCADAIVNHLDKAKQLGWPTLNLIIRTCVGTDTPLNPGCQHKGDYYGIWKQLLKEVDVRQARTPADVMECYEGILDHKGPVMVVEYRDMYDLPTLPTALGKPSL